MRKIPRQVPLPRVDHESGAFERVVQRRVVHAGGQMKGGEHAGALFCRQQRADAERGQSVANPRGPAPIQITPGHPSASVGKLVERLVEREAGVHRPRCKSRSGLQTLEIEIRRRRSKPATQKNAIR